MPGFFLSFVSISSLERSFSVFMYQRAQDMTTREQQHHSGGTFNCYEATLLDRRYEKSMNDFDINLSFTSIVGKYLHFIYKFHV